MRPIVHVTDAASSGVLAAVTGIARAQSALPGAKVEFAYVPRADSPPPARIQEMTGPRVRVRRLTANHRMALPALTVGLARLLVSRRSAVIHLHSSRSGMLGRALAALSGSRSRTVYSPHCFAFDRAGIDGARRKVFVGLERLGARLGPHLVLVSETERDLARRVLPGVRTGVLTNRVGEDVLALGEDGAARAASTGTLRIVHVGRIASQKRPEDFAAQARRRHALEAQDQTAARTQFRWLGDGDRSRLGPEVQVAGWLDRSALLSELAEADLMLFTSAGEGMPIAVLEAQAAGVPVIAHDVTGIRDLITDGETGVLVPVGGDLGGALDALLADPARRSALAAAARERVREHHSPGTLAEDSLSAYREAAVP